MDPPPPPPAVPPPAAPPPIEFGGFAAAAPPVQVVEFGGFAAAPPSPGGDPGRFAASTDFDPMGASAGQEAPGLEKQKSDVDEMLEKSFSTFSLGKKAAVPADPPSPAKPSLADMKKTTGGMAQQQAQMQQMQQVQQMQQMQMQQQQPAAIIAQRAAPSPGRMGCQPSCGTEQSPRYVASANNTPATSSSANSAAASGPPPRKPVKMTELLASFAAQLGQQGQTAKCETVVDVGRGYRMGNINYQQAMQRLTDVVGRPSLVAEVCRLSKLAGAEPVAFSSGGTREGWV
uniref:Uncharacterized protein n=1 Tax=Haptolina ericina TaxID=156174 RepID=A0A7S3F1R8_9EUKA